jgi:hypothetical protein
MYSPKIPIEANRAAFVDRIKRTKDVQPGIVLLKYQSNAHPKDKIRKTSETRVPKNASI